jgi:hypothetical protein
MLKAKVKYQQKKKLHIYKYMEVIFPCNSHNKKPYIWLSTVQLIIAISVMKAQVRVLWKVRL